MFTNPSTEPGHTMPDAPPLRKFMFDRTFEPGSAQRTAERKPVTLKPDQYDTLKKESFDAGFAEGHKAGQDAQHQRLVETLWRIDERITQMIQNMEAVRSEQDAKMRQMVVAIVRKVFPTYTSKYGLEEIQTMLNDVMSDMVHEPRFVVRLNPAEFDSINGKIDEMSQQKAYAGKVVVLADPDIACGDCRVEWADGGIERAAESTLDDITNLVVPAEANM